MGYKKTFWFNGIFPLIKKRPEKTRQEKVAKERAEIDEDAEVMAHQRVVSWIGELDMLDTGEGLDVGWC